MKSQLFVYALIWHPNADQVKNNEKSKIIKEPTYLLSKDKETASLQIAMNIPKEHENNLDQIEIVLSPF